MKIGIVTQPLHNNYGGLLQNFALQQVLKKLGHEVKTIDFVYKYSFVRYLLSTCKQLILAILKCRCPILRSYVQCPCVRKLQMAEFVTNYIDTTEVVHKYSSSIIRKENFDVIITGSDQVWRPCYNIYIENMFLKFVPNSIKKVAYAASFGVDNWEYSPKQTLKCAKLAQCLDAVSVREQSGVDLCKKYFNVEAKCVLDPTILAGPDAYKALLKEYNGNKYLFAYVLDLTLEKETLIRSLAEKNNLEVKIASADDNASLSVEEWLTMIANADMVVTDSFHGTVFSILFHSEFYSIVNVERGGTRFYSLLTPLGLESRLLDASSIEVPQIGNVTWNVVDEKLDELRENSMDFLKKALNHA